MRRARTAAARCRAWWPLAFALIVATRLSAQSSAHPNEVRFAIVSVGDSTFDLATGPHEWVARGQRGVVVDPAHHDVLIARFEIVRLNAPHTQATALITGQTSRVSSDHVALIDEPPARWFRQRVFWIGAGIGAVLGATVGLAASPRH
jgi:hypothetical protein